METDNIARRQTRLCEAFLSIEDPQERLAAIIERVRTAPLPPSERIEANRVRGCVSAVWLTGEIHEGRLHLRFDADSPLVKGLAGLIVEVAQDAALDDIATSEVTLIETLGLHRNLSPTRQNGLAAVRKRIRALAGALH